MSEPDKIVAIAAAGGPDGDTVYALDAAGRLWMRYDMTNAGKWIPLSTPQTEQEAEK